ncbi:MAG: hypothetical protein OXI33_05770 [Chloroflexota bacterium]|nr:hypothetical protein [Chloroflexota bacterium]
MLRVGIAGTCKGGSGVGDWDGSSPFQYLSVLQSEGKLHPHGERMGQEIGIRQLFG